LQAQPVSADLRDSLASKQQRDSVLFAGRRTAAPRPKARSRAIGRCARAVVIAAMRCLVSPAAGG